MVGQCSMVSWVTLYMQLTWSAGVNKVGNKTEQTGHAMPTPDRGSSLILTNAVLLHKWLICPASFCVLYVEVHCLQYLKATSTTIPVLLWLTHPGTLVRGTFTEFGGSILGWPNHREFWFQVTWCGDYLAWQLGRYFVLRVVLSHSSDWRAADHPGPSILGQQGWQNGQFLAH
jgi:hypothetical protein